MSKTATRHCVYDAPLALDPTLSRTNGLDPLLARSRGKQHVIDTREHIIGPMPVAGFISHFLPMPEHDVRDHFFSSRDAFKAIPSHAKTATEIRDPLLRALQRKTKYRFRCPGFIFDCPTTPTSRQGRLGYMKPDICCYAVDNRAHVLESDRSSRVEFSHAELFIEIRPDPARDVFTDPTVGSDGATSSTHDFLTSTDDPEVYDELDKALGQHISYAVEVLARQFRTFLFSIAMAGSRARLLRWDRSGCVVTESFDIREEPEPLCEFLWRFSQTSDAGRGHDCTALLASPTEETLFRDAIKEHVVAQLGCEGEELEKAVRQHYEPGRVYALDVLYYQFTADAENMRRFVVSRPVVSPLSLVGRGTRGYWALDVTTSQVVFLKDTWRHFPLLDIEGETIRRLTDIGVRYIPMLVWHGDVHKRLPTELRKLGRDEIQSTETDVLASSPWVCRVRANETHASARRHYRIITSPAGYSLKTVRGTEELLHATHDVYAAMRDALSKDLRIHRDISVGNIVLVKDGDSEVRRGYLIDWEASCNVDSEGQAEEVGRAGTWQFMSFRMLDDANTKQTFQDDMESLLYVILYCALLWQPHNFNQDYLTTTLSRVFDDCVNMRGYSFGGSGKLANMLHRKYTRSLVLDSKSLQEFLDTMMDYHSPPPPDKEVYKDKWSNPDHLDTYWTSFLQTHALEPANRVVHSLDESEYYDPNSPPTPVGTKSLSSSGSGKHRSSSPEQGVTSAVKRAHSSAQLSSPADRAPVTKPKDISPPPLRRSRRIQERQSKEEGEIGDSKDVKGRTRSAQQGRRGSGRGRRGSNTRK